MKAKKNDDERPSGRTNKKVVRRHFETLNEADFSTLGEINHSEGSGHSARHPFAASLGKARLLEHGATARQADDFVREPN
jgi:hypothetical protein